MQDAFNAAALAPIRPAGSRTPPSRRAPNGVLVPTLLIAGEDDTWSFREGLLRELVNAPEKKHVTIPHATHFVLFETQRVRFFESSTVEPRR